MFDAAIAKILLEVLLAALLLYAAVVDMRTLVISNRFNLAVAALAPVYWLAAGLPLWPGVVVQVVLAIGEIGRRVGQRSRRRCVKPRDFGPAIAFEEERSRAPGRMIAALVLGLD